MIVLANLKEVGRGYKSRNDGGPVGGGQGKAVYPPPELPEENAVLLSP